MKRYYFFCSIILKFFFVNSLLAQVEVSNNASLNICPLQTVSIDFTVQEDSDGSFNEVTEEFICDIILSDYTNFEFANISVTKGAGPSDINGTPSIINVNNDKRVKSIMLAPSGALDKLTITVSIRRKTSTEITGTPTITLSYSGATTGSSSCDILTPEPAITLGALSSVCPGNAISIPFSISETTNSPVTAVKIFTGDDAQLTNGFKAPTDLGSGQYSTTLNLHLDDYVPGLVFYHYDNQAVTMLSNFAAIPITTVGESESFTLTPVLSLNSDPDDFFTAVFEGRIYISTAAEYRFYVKSDDGMKLYIDNTLKIDNDGITQSGAETEQVDVTLSVGYHDLKIEYMERDLANSLELRYYRGPNSDKSWTNATEPDTDELSHKTNKCIIQVDYDYNDDNIIDYFLRQDISTNISSAIVAPTISSVTLPTDNAACPGENVTCSINMNPANGCKFTKLVIQSSADGTTWTEAISVNSTGQGSVNSFPIDYNFPNYTSVNYRVLATYSGFTVEFPISKASISAAYMSKANFKFSPQIDFITEGCKGTPIVFNFNAPCNPELVQIQIDNAGVPFDVASANYNYNAATKTLSITQILTGSNTNISFRALYANGDIEVITQPINSSTFIDQTVASMQWSPLNTNLCPGGNAKFDITYQNSCSEPEVYILDATQVQIAGPLAHTSDGYSYAFNPDKQYSVSLKFKNGTTSVQETVTIPIQNLRNQYQTSSIQLDVSQLTKVCYGENLSIPVTFTNFCQSASYSLKITNSQIGDYTKDNFTLSGTAGAYTIQYKFAVGDQVQLIANYGNSANPVSSNTITITNSMFTSPVFSIDNIQSDKMNCDLSNVTVKILVTNVACGLDTIAILKDGLTDTLGVFNFSVLEKNLDTVYVSVYLNKDLVHSLSVKAHKTITFTDRNKKSKIPFLSMDNASVGDNATDDIKLQDVTPFKLLSNKIELTGEDATTLIGAANLGNLFYFYPRNFEILKDVSTTRDISIYSDTTTNYYYIDPSKSDRGTYYNEVRFYTDNTKCYVSDFLTVKIQPETIAMDNVYCYGSDTSEEIIVALSKIADYNNTIDYSPTYGYRDYCLFNSVTITWGTDSDTLVSTEIAVEDSVAITTDSVDLTSSMSYKYIFNPTSYFETIVGNDSTKNEINLTCLMWADIVTYTESIYNGRGYDYEMEISETENGFRGDFYLSTSGWANGGGGQISTHVMCKLNNEYFHEANTIDELNAYFDKQVSELYKNYPKVENDQLHKKYMYKYMSNSTDYNSWYYVSITRYDVLVIKTLDVRAKIFSIVKPTTTLQLKNLNDKYCNNDKEFILLGSDLATTDLINGIGVNKSSLGYEFNPSDPIFKSIKKDTNIVISYSYKDIINSCPYTQDKAITISASPRNTISIQDLCQGDKTQFLAIKDSTDQTEHKKWTWSFGDGFVDTLGKSITHTYPRVDSFPVRLTTTNNLECSSIADTTIIIEDYPKLEISFDHNLADLQNTIRNNSVLNNTKIEKIDTVVWSIISPEGIQDSFEQELLTDTSMIASIPYTFSTSGIYQVNLYASTKNQCISDTTIPLPIFDVIPVTNEDSYPAASNSDFQDWLVSSNYTDFNKNLPTWQNAAIGENISLIDDNHSADQLVWSIQDSTNQHVWLESPCFDLSDLTVPMIQFDLYQSVEAGFDGLVVQYLINGTDSWKVLGALGEGIEWYDTKGAVSRPGTVGDDVNALGYAWATNNKVWKTVAYPIDDLLDELPDGNSPTGIECVRFRLVFASNASNPTATEDDILEGTAVSNFIVSKRNKVVLVEQFVNNEITGSLDEEKFVDQTFTTDEYCVIKYHIEKDFKKDAIYNVNSVDVSARAQEYGSPAKNISTTIDGIENYEMSLSSQKEIINSFVLRRNLLIPKYSISEVNMENINGNLLITATVRKDIKDGSDVYDNYQTFVRIAIVDPEYKIGNSISKDVLVELLPNGSGNYVYAFNSSDPAGTETKLSSLWIPGDNVDISEDLKLVIYVQDMVGENEVHQVFQEVIPKYLAVSLSNPLKDSQINYVVYPNPADDYVSITAEGGANGIWELYSATGCFIDQGILDENSDNRIDIRKLADGMYFFDIINQENNVQKLWFIKH